MLDMKRGSLMCSRQVKCCEQLIIVPLIIIIIFITTLY